jgi:hypothetical protein
LAKDLYKKFIKKEEENEVFLLSLNKIKLKSNEIIELSFDDTIDKDWFEDNFQSEVIQLFAVSGVDD